MDKLNLKIFDTFSYILPGSLVLLNIYLLIFFNFNKELTVAATLTSLWSSASTIKFNIGLIILLLSFILGNILQPFGYKYFNIVGKKLFKRRLENCLDELDTLESARVIIRQHSKNNYDYVELWQAYRAMSFNLSLAILLLTFVLVFKLIESSLLTFNWILALVTLVSASLVLLLRAATFHKWTHDTCTETLTQMKIELVLKGSATPPLNKRTSWLSKIIKRRESL